MVRVPAENSVSTAKPFANRARLLLAKGAIAPFLFANRDSNEKYRAKVSRP